MSRRAALYLRISEDREGNELAIERQREDGLELIARRGWSHAGEYVDNDVSAAGKKKRPGFDALIAAVEAGEADTIVAVEQSRLSRNRRDDLRIVNACMPRSVLLAFTRAADIDMGTAAGRLVADVMAATARHEIEVKSERHRKQIAQAVKAGRPTGAPRAFGYRRGGMEIEPSEKYAVEQLFSRFLAGDGLGTLSDWLNRQGYKTTKGLPWRPQTVRVVLANPRYAGLRGIKHVVDEATGRYSMYHDVKGEAAWPGIVSEETWRAALAILQDPARPGRHTGSGPLPRRLLSTVAECGTCGEYVIGATVAGKIPGYKCRTGGHLIRRAHHIDEYVQHAVVARLRRPDAVDLLAPPAEGRESLDKVRAEVMAKRLRRDDLTKDYADGVLDRDQMRAANERLRVQIADLEAQIAEAGQTDVVSPLVLAEDDDAAWAVWDAYTVGAKQSVFRILCRIIIHRGRPGRPPGGQPFAPSTVEIVWR